MVSGNEYKYPLVNNDGYKTGTPADYYVYNNKIYKDLWTVFADWFYANLENVLDEGEEKDDAYKNFMEKIAGKGLEQTDKDEVKAIVESDPTGYLQATFSQTIKFSDYEKKLDEIGPTLYENGISAYPDGKNYYKYWIRHSNNDDPDVMGVMEFAIVRNNIYDLTVTKVSGMGESPFKPTDPENPDEGQDHYISVEIYVKDWVVRDNGNIEL